MKPTIEFRKDIVSGDWVLISTDIQKKPVFFKKAESKPLPKSKCPFEGVGKLKQEKILKTGGFKFFRINIRLSRALISARRWKGAEYIEKKLASGFRK